MRLTFAPTRYAAICSRRRARYIGAVKEVVMTFRPSAIRLAEVALAASLALAPIQSPPAFAAAADDAGSKPATANPLPPDAEKFFQSIFKVRIRAVPNARSSATLGEEREGTAVVIGDDGLLVTIGYLIVEADEVSLVDQKGKTIPARVVAYDHATGLGLVRAITPLAAPALPLGESGKLATKDPVMIVNHAGVDDVTLAYVVSTRPFTGNWEYLLEQAIFTSPPTMNWSGAALVSRDFKLVGVGSLIVREASSSGDSALPGNMFVPIDALKPILPDLLRTGRRAGPPRPWLGVAADEVSGRLMVSRVSPDGPGDQAGIKVGDIILAVGGDGVRTQAEFYRKVWGRGAAGTDIPLRVLQGVDVKELAVHSIDRIEYFRPKTTY
jgi:S1-C subfamily serine protease